MVRPRGRPRKLSRKLIAELTANMSLGMTLKDVCACSHIAYSTFREWINKGKELQKSGVKPVGRDALFLEFLEANDRADALLKKRALNNLRILSNDSVQANIFLLERRFPDEWGRRNPIDGDPMREGIHVTITRVTAPPSVPVEAPQTDDDL